MAGQLLAMVTDKIRWVTAGGTPAGVPCLLMAWTMSMPEVTLPKSEYEGGRASPWAPVTMKN